MHVQTIQPEHQLLVPAHFTSRERQVPSATRKSLPAIFLPEQLIAKISKDNVLLELKYHVSEPMNADKSGTFVSISTGRNTGRIFLISAKLERSNFVGLRNCLTTIRAEVKQLMDNATLTVRQQNHRITLKMIDALIYEVGKRQEIIQNDLFSS